MTDRNAKGRDVEYEILVGKVSKMWKNGFTNLEIATKLDEPEEKIEKIIELCKEAEGHMKR